MVAVDAATMAAAIPGLMMVTAKISNPVLTPDVFNKWYSDVHVRDMVTNNFASLALRYTNYSLGQTAPPASTIGPASDYLALYNVPDINFINNPGTMSKLPLNHDSLPNKVSPVTTWSQWVFTYWLPVQALEGKSTATTRPAYVLVEKADPGSGGEEELDQFYQKQHLDFVSTPGYRRSTRWKSSTGGKPKYLILHEVDNLGATIAEMWAKKSASAKISDHSSFGLILEKGNLQEKLG